jgi:protocatechuate 3,4-dioxygenase beta subunit
MTARRCVRPTGHLAAGVRTEWARTAWARTAWARTAWARTAWARTTGARTAWARTAWAPPRRGRRTALTLLLLAGLGAWAGAIAGAPALATGEKGGDGGSPGETGTSPTATGTSNCPSPNPPNELTLVAGTPQTTTLDTAFASGLQVALTNSDGCAVTGAAGVPVTFSAPAAGAGGRFSTNNSNTAIVGADASGSVAAPTLTANGTAGSYTVTASSQYGSVSFALTNTAGGIPARIVAIPLKRRSASVSRRYPEPLQVKVLDAGGNPVVGIAVTFTLGSSATSTCGTSTSSSAGATFAGGSTQATATTDASGLATSPAFTAGTAADSFTATASVSSGGGGVGGGESAGKAGATTTVAPVSFSLSNLAGKPTKLTPGIGSTQSTLAGTPFPIRLAVTVTDAQKNPVSGALITFSAPLADASGRFTVHSDSSHHRARVTHPYTVKVKTDACGIAVAPAFTANDTQGGYIVKATVEHARPAAFALVNEAPGQSQ